MGIKPMHDQAPDIGVAPWKPSVPQQALPANDVDPRSGLSGDELGEASRIAFPIVAKQKARRDGLGLLAGAAIALVLGAAVFVGLNSARMDTPPPTKSTESNPIEISGPPAAFLEAPASAEADAMAPPPIIAVSPSQVR